MMSTSRASRLSRRASCDMTCRRRARWKSSWASAPGKPVSRLIASESTPRTGGPLPTVVTADRPSSCTRWTTAPRVAARSRAPPRTTRARERSGPSNPGSRLPRVVHSGDRRSEGMESGSTAAGTAAPGTERPGDWGPGEKGLKANAIGYASNIVIGVASTAPGYSLAATLGFIVAVPGVGLHAPAVLLVAFVPMLCIAFGYRYMNRADPDCGTTFAWVTRGMGPHLGWLSGWAIVAADIIVMASLAQIAGIYTFLLFGWQSAADTMWAVTIVGVVWIAIMTWICVIGIELNAKTQRWLLTAEVLTLAIFAVVALVKVYSDPISGSTHPDLGWLNPFQISSFNALIDGVLLGIFIYWGCDSGVAVNEESEDSANGPGKAAVISTLLLVLIYVVVSFAAQAYGGTKELVDNQDDVLSALGSQVFGSPFDKL